MNNLIKQAASLSISATGLSSFALGLRISWQTHAPLYDAGSLSDVATHFAAGVGTAVGAVTAGTVTLAGVAVLAHRRPRTEADLDRLTFVGCGSLVAAGLVGSMIGYGVTEKILAFKDMPAPSVTRSEPFIVPQP